MRIGIYPGTFDPITLGHMDIIRRGMRLVDKLVIGVTTNPSKSPMFSDEERLEMVRRETAELGDGVEVVGFNMLLMKFAEKQGADVSLQPIASRLVKEIAMFGGEIHKFVTPLVADEITARVQKIGLKGDQ